MPLISSTFFQHKDKLEGFRVYPPCWESPIMDDKTQTYFYLILMGVASPHDFTTSRNFTPSAGQ